MQTATGREMIEQFDATDFNHPVQLAFQSGGFRIENDFPHYCSIVRFWLLADHYSGTTPFSMFPEKLWRFYFRFDRAT
ncbi:hypothetical protein RvVAT039_16700 [Agrobacterium vitis]|nr:hypothetical protein RvVAT039_16700 [Agrobacterium vitis]